MKILKWYVCGLTLLLAPLLFSACGEKPDTQIQAPHKHNYVLEEFIESPTCTEAGLKYMKCPTDGEYIEVVIPAVGHNYKNFEAIPPTDLTDGLMIQVCTRCDHADRTQDRAIPKLTYTATPLNFNTEVSYTAAKQNAAWYNFSVDETALFHFTGMRNEGWGRYEIFNADGECVLDDDNIPRWSIGFVEFVFSLSAGDYSLRIGTSRVNSDSADSHPNWGESMEHEHEYGEVRGTFILNNIADIASALPTNRQVTETYDNIGVWHKLTVTNEIALPEVVYLQNEDSYLRRRVYDINGNEIEKTDVFIDSVYSLPPGDYYFHISASPYENNETVTADIFYGAITLPHLETVDLSELSFGYVWCKFEFKNEHDFINIMAPYNSWRIYKLENNDLLNINIGYNHHYKPEIEITEGIYYILLELDKFAEAEVAPEICYGIKPMQLNETVLIPAAGIPGVDGGNVRKLVLTEDTAFVFAPVNKQRQEANIVIDNGETEVLNLGLNVYHDMVIKLSAGTYFVHTYFSKTEIVETDDGPIQRSHPAAGEFRLLTAEQFITLTPNVGEGFPEIDAHGCWYKIDITVPDDYQFNCAILNGFTGYLRFKIFDGNFDRILSGDPGYILTDYDHYVMNGIHLDAGTYYINLWNDSEQYTKATLSVSR